MGYEPKASGVNLAHGGVVHIEACRMAGMVIFTLTDGTWFGVETAQLSKFMSIMRGCMNYLGVEELH